MINEYIDKPLEVGTVLKENFDGEINYYILMIMIILKFVLISLISISIFQLLQKMRKKILLKHLEKIILYGMKKKEHYIASLMILQLS